MSRDRRPGGADRDSGRDERRPSGAAGERGRARDATHPPDDRAASIVAGLALLVAAGSGLALAAVMLLGGPTPLQGVLVFACLGSLGAGIVVWGHRLLDPTQYVERRPPIGSGPATAREVAVALTDAPGLSRRRILRWLLLAAVGGVGAALVAPFLRLQPDIVSGSRPGWRRGSRVVDETGRPVRAADLPVGGIRTVFPEDGVGSADAQAVLIRVEPGLLRLPPDREGWAPDGLVAYSKVCTHAGCPVSLYRVTSHELVCPCHQSTYLALEGARPVFGPAVRALPQLPVTIGPDGILVADGDFAAPVGPSTWTTGAGQTDARA